MRALEQTATIADAVVKVGGVVVSGLARGVDAHAHRAAIQSGGKTIAVLGTPIDQFAVADLASLQSEIGREHLLVSQFASGSVVDRSFFPRRNRTMAVIAQASIIVHARAGSGTLHHAREAIRLGRPTFIVAAAYNTMSEAWAAELFAAGARQLETVDAAIEAIGARDPQVRQGSLWE